MKAGIGSVSRTEWTAIVASLWRNRRIQWTIGLLVAALLSLPTGTALGQAVNQIMAISPNSAAQGATNLSVTFTLDNDSPPAPPAGVIPNSVTIGSMIGTSVMHSSQYIVTAVFNIPTGEPTGAKDAVITFFPPVGGTLTFSMYTGFTVTSGENMPPSITQHPQSQTVAPGGSVTFTVTASGTPPLQYQWQNNAIDISGATSTSFTINPVAESDSGHYRCIVTNGYGTATFNEAVLTVAAGPTNSYPIVDTKQDVCYDTSVAITCRQPGQPFYGQDAQYDGNQPSYTLSEDGLSVFDNNTGLTWQRSPDRNGDGQIRATDKLSWADLQTYPVTLNAATFGGYSDWRLPNIKELYSLIEFRGTDPSGGETTGLVPFIDTDYFEFAYGDTGAGERIIDAQYTSSTMYVSHIYEDDLFGVNFADGRIKGYGLIMPGGADKTFFVKCVRGSTTCGVNSFVNNGDGTIADRATGLMWSQADSRTGLNWQAALAWVQARNAADYCGHNDWRLPDVKELQSIVDYTRAPDVTNSAAIDPVFVTSSITNEGGQIDYPCYWASTTHVNLGAVPGAYATYVAFGRALGYMGGAWHDVHGSRCAAQRS